MKKISFNLIGIWACYALAIFITIYNFGPLINAKWGMIDDHGIMSVIGPNNNRLPFSEIPEALKKTEIGRDSLLPRFRPSYYVLHMIECAIWGKNPALWYGFRIGIASFLAVMIAYFSIILAGPILTFGFLIFTLCAPYWSDIFARAGPAEIYASLGLCLIALGWGAKWRKSLEGLSAFCISIGLLIAVGSKENFLILLFLPLWLLLTNQVKTSAYTKILFLSVLGYITWIATTVFFRLHLSGVDVYSNDVSISSSIRLVKSFLIMPKITNWLIGLVFFLIITALVRMIGQCKTVAKWVLLSNTLSKFFVTCCVLFIIYGSQYIFYHGAWPDGQELRYSFPGVLALHFTILIGAVAILRLIEAAGYSFFWVLSLQLIFSMLFFVGALNQIHANRIASNKTIMITNRFNTNMHTIVKFLKNNPSQILIINSNNVFDYEPVESIAIFLKAYGVTNSMALKINNYSSHQSSVSSLAINLAKSLEALQAEGRNPNFIPLRMVNLVDCFSVGMNGPFLNTCIHGGVNIWP